MSIPKLIHYCWFGGKRKPPIVKKCIRSWKKYCPEYTIIEWNEDNFDVNSLLFCQQAYAARKWAFVTDYVRLKVLYDMGGIYMDTDVELLKPLDNYLQYPCFMGFQHEQYVATGLIVGAEKHHAFIGENAAVYHQLEFHDHDDSRKLVVCQEYTTSLLKKRGLTLPCTGEIQQIGDIRIFPPEYFCPYDHRTKNLTITANTTAIHHFASSWWDAERKRRYRKDQRARYFYEITHIPNKLAQQLLGPQYYQKLKNLLRKR